MRGDVTINNLDAYDNWGINFEDGALTALMTPPALKEFIESNSRLAHGKVVLTEDIMHNTLARYDARDITLPFHMIANSKEDFMEKYNDFCQNVLSEGSFSLKTKYIPNVVYRLIFVSCTQFRQFDQRMAVFSLKVQEPNPADRAITQVSDE